MDLGPEVSGWNPRARPVPQVFVGQHVRLEPVSKDHSAALFAAFKQSDANWAYLPYGPFAALAEFEAWMNQTVFGEDPQFYTFIPKTLDAPAGLASLMRHNLEHGSIEVGHIHFSPALQGTVAATEGLFLLMDHCLKDLGYRRFEWKCNALNTPSRKAAERLGFTFEGIHRQANVFKDRSRDTAWFSILDSEWPDLRAGFEAWLSVENFDGEGRQKRSLAECRS